ncbi:MAG: nickel-dependent hydrogenase large subunit [Sulfolobales archaeon]
MSVKVDFKVDKVFGHLELQIELVDGEARARFASTEDLRYFEYMVIGRKYYEVPYIMSRICGACSISHFLASVNAIENALKVELDEEVVMLKEVMNKLEIAQNTVVHLYFLALPDYLKMRNLGELLAAKPDIVKSAMMLNSLCLQAVNAIAGRIVNPNTYRVGGFTKKLPKEALDKAVKVLDKAEKLAEELSEVIVGLELPQLSDPELNYLTVDPPTEYLTMSDYLVGSDGSRFKGLEYGQYLTEEVSEYSTTKYCLYRGRAFFVGPRARLLAFGERLSEYSNILADVKKELTNPFSNLKAKTVELLFCISNSKTILNSLAERNLNLSASVKVRQGEGVGVIEAPRGLLIHHYVVNDQGVITHSNVITPTAMFSRHIEASARVLANELVSSGASLDEVERKAAMLVRACDPCLPCSVHLISSRRGSK